jgi:hypothetical protein
LDTFNFFTDELQPLKVHLRIHLQPLVLKPHQPGFISHSILMDSFDMILAYIMKAFHPAQLTQQMLQQYVELWSKAQTQMMPLRQDKGGHVFKLLKHLGPFLTQRTAAPHALR